MHQFWKHGYEGTSIGDLVNATNVGRSSLYSEFGGKRDLFLACLAHYKVFAVSPAFECVEAEGAGLGEIEVFLQNQIRDLLELGFPVRGCLVGNTMTELAAHDPEIGAAVRNHYDRMTQGFLQAIVTEFSLGTDQHALAQSIAETLTISIHGLWAYARSVSTAASLYERADALIELVRYRLTK